MANSEREPLNHDQPTQSELEKQLREIDRQLEIADENENTIERTNKCEHLQEIREAIETELTQQDSSELIQRDDSTTTVSQ